MEVRAKIDESDRPNLVAGQPAVGRSRCACRREIHGADRPAVRAGQPRQLLRVGRRRRVCSTSRFQFDQPDPRLKAGVSARVTLDGKECRTRIHVPRQAVFDKNGKNSRVRQGRRSLRAARGQGRAAHREPRRDLRRCRKAPKSRSSIPPSTGTTTAGSPAAPTRAGRAEGTR